MIVKLFTALLLSAIPSKAVNQTFSFHDIFVIEINVATVTSQSAADYIAREKSQDVINAFTTTVGEEFFILTYESTNETFTFFRHLLEEPTGDDFASSSESDQADHIRASNGDSIMSNPSCKVHPGYKNCAVLGMSRHKGRSKRDRNLEGAGNNTFSLNLEAVEYAMNSALHGNCGNGT